MRMLGLLMSMLSVPNILGLLGKDMGLTLRKKSRTIVKLNQIALYRSFYMGNLKSIIYIHTYVLPVHT